MEAVPTIAYAARHGQVLIRSQFREYAHKLVISLAFRVCKCVRVCVGVCTPIASQFVDVPTFSSTN